MTNEERNDALEKARVVAAYVNGLLIVFVVVWNTVFRGQFDLGVVATLVGLQAGILALSPGVIRIVRGGG